MSLKNTDEFKTEIDPKTDTPHRIMGAFMTSAYLLMTSGNTQEVTAKLLDDGKTVQLILNGEVVQEGEINLVPMWNGPVGHA